MKSSNLWARAFAIVALALLVAGGAYAQLQTGNLYGTVTDEQSSPLPGATVTLTGQGAPQVQVTNAQGQFRFLGLPPGTVGLKAELEGFSTIDYPTVTINIGRNTTIEVKLSAAVEDVITVTAESPLLDERRISAGATVAATELEKIPTSRDPWAILTTTPGVLTDRINVGGNESGQQSQYVGPGSTGDQAVWSVDGVVITDMAATGSSPAYYDFDAFEEMQVTTGGSDTTNSTGGVVLNMVTKRGTNEWRGSGRYYLADDQWQSDSSLDNSDFGTNFDGAGPVTAQAAFNRSNRVISVKDYGAELGGPVWRDHIWIWGSYGKQLVDLRTAPATGFPNGVKDFTTLKTWNGKLNAQITASNSGTLFAFNNDKVKIGRSAGPLRPQETTWDQGHFGPTPSAYKVEDTQIFSSNFYLTGLYSKVNGGFQLVPQGGSGRGAGNPTAYFDPATSWHNTYGLYQTERPQEQIKADSSLFFNTGNLSHELKFGAGHRKVETTTNSDWPGVGYIYDLGAFGYPYEQIGLSRQELYTVEQKLVSLYAQDTLTVGRLTANVGLRYDRQTADNLPSTAAANPLFPNVLPAVAYDGSDPTPEWTDITPRLGLTYALGAERKTLLRASYARFADQMGAGIAAASNPLGAQSYAIAYTYAHNTPTAADVFGCSGPLAPACGFSSNVNPLTGGILRSGGFDPDLEAQISDELLLSAEHALLPEFVVGLNLTYRKISNVIENRLQVFDSANPHCATCLTNIGRQARPDDYVQVTSPSVVLPDGTSRTLTYFRLKPTVSTRGGVVLANGDNEQEYKGASVTFNKRLANRWMLRGNFTYSDWQWSKVVHPQNPASFYTAAGVPSNVAGGTREGDAVLQGSGTGSGAKGGVYINSKWAYSVNGLYQIAPDRPWGFNAALSLTGREGYPIPYYFRVTLPANNQPTTRQFIAATDRPDDVRLDDIRTVDARVEKEFAFSDFGLTLGVDVFNVFNEGTVLQRNHRLALANSNWVTETLSPRLYRVGARFSFR